MDYPSKIQIVKDHLASWQEDFGDEFRYQIDDFSTENNESGEVNIYLHKSEHLSILNYLASKGYLQIQENSDHNSPLITILPKTEPIIKLRTLELITESLVEYYTAEEIISLLKESGVDKRFIIFPNSKWSIFLTVFNELVVSKDTKDKDILFKIIGNSIHPLQFPDGMEKTSEMLQNKFNKYLEFDNDLVIEYSKEDKKYKINHKLDEEETFEELMAERAHDEEEFYYQRQSELEFLQKNQETISTLRKAYRLLINISETFCSNHLKPTIELNNAYIKCKDFIVQKVLKLGLYNPNKIYRLNSYTLPFDTLYNAEKYYKQNGKTLHWDSIRPDMYATYSDIEEIYRLVDGSDIISESTTQEMFNKIALLLTQTKEENKKNERERQKAIDSQIPEHKIKIISLPELHFKNIAENIITKGKKTLYLPRFPRTDWSKVSIRFLSERDVILSDGYENKPADFISLGFQDGRTGRPDIAWNFLLNIAKNAGETNLLKKSERETQKKYKQKITDILRKIFNNQSEPFHDFYELKKYKANFELIPPPKDIEQDPIYQD